MIKTTNVLQTDEAFYGLSQEENSEIGKLTLSFGTVTKK